MDTPDGEKDVRGCVVVKQDGDKLNVSAGPNASEQFEATNVKLDGKKLSFNAQPPNASEAWKFELTFDADRLAGTVAMNRDGEIRTGKLDLKRQ